MCQEGVIKFDVKYMLIFLVGVIGVLLGLLVGRNSSTTSSSLQMPADDGKLAKEYKEKNLVKLIRDNAKDIQTCYLDLLKKENKNIEGTLTLLFKLEEDGEISNTKVTGSSFNNNNFESCVTKKFDGLYLSPPPIGINRYISHDLAFKDEQTALKEAEEKKQNSKPPEILPVK